ncbi:hypothetical protein [Massilia horti]|uniref:Uncharacterized protein n=1 Tax=Massilia horti TaxID=2562153 RepID=A0A4Y9SWB2_9BURK|nr:hypothetical protein [Massilia horti]TFW30755.1 hypothetical protein E4O92_15585 [Massilia horti]
MNDLDFERRFTWEDVIADGVWAGVGWAQHCLLSNDRIDIACRQVPEAVFTKLIKLTIIACDEVTLIELPTANPYFASTLQPCRSTQFGLVFDRQLRRKHTWQRMSC